MKKELKTIEFAGKNFKIVNLEFNGKDVYFDIRFGTRDTMYMSGDICFNLCGGEIDSADLELQPFDWEYRNTTGFLNKRNTKLICEAIEKIAMQDPESCGFDWEEYFDGKECFNENLREDLKMESCANY